MQKYRRQKTEQSTHIHEIFSFPLYRARATEKINNSEGFLVIDRNAAMLFNFFTKVNEYCYQHSVRTTTEIL